VQFLNPAFLFAASALAIPLLIHLFNLRRYKTVNFPHTRFLKDLQLHSQKQSKVQYKWLLLARMLFLLFLVLAFAQPFFPGNKANADQKLRVLYIDNSMSMSAGKSQKTLLDVAKENARRLILSHNGSFLVCSNDAPASYEPLSQQAALQAVENIKLSAASTEGEQIIKMIEGITQDKGAVDLYYLSDFQRKQFSPGLTGKLPERLHFNGVQIAAPEQLGNIYVDTAYLEYPSLQNGKQNRLIVRTRYAGKVPEEQPILQLSLDGAVKSAAGLDFRAGNERQDTLTFETSGSGWHRLSVSVNDLHVHFDDTLLIAAKSASDLSVLLVEEGKPNVFVQAALRSYPGFKIRETSVSNLPEDRNNYNLILLADVNRLSPTLVTQLQGALAAGVNVCLLPGAQVDPAEMSRAIRPLAGIEWGNPDTSAQTASELRQEHPMIRDMFERIPENVQLPFVRLHYPLKAAANTETQSIISFRNGDPFFAVYPTENARLFICSTPADPAYGNFQSSYFFVPFLYQMASLSQSGDIYAVFSGQTSTLFVPTKENRTRGLFHLKGSGTDLIPGQRAQGRGVLIDARNLSPTPGFYTLSNGSGDSSLIGLNMSRVESDLTCWSLSELKSSSSRKGDTWQLADAENSAVSKTQLSSFPLWKLCSILALGMLGLEIYLLSRKHYRKHTITN
jgi:hypothetical protein